MTELENLSELRNWNPGVTLVGNCAVCGKPVRQSDDPMPVYAESDATTPSGFIHGAFDCMDAESCTEQRSVTAGSGIFGIQGCSLPELHPGECLWGEPA